MIWRSWLVGIFLLIAGCVHASSYEAKLPAALATDADLCRYLDCKSVLPGADKFTPRKGQPPYVEALNKQGQIIGYVYLSTDVADIPAYSGKPVVTLVGLDASGRIAGVRILKHSEPILLLGIPEQKLVDYVAQYIGHLAGTRFELGKADGNYVPMDAISGATVTLIAQNQLITRTSKAIARQAGIVKGQERAPAKFIDNDRRLDWAGLLDEGSVKHLTVSHEDVGEAANDKPYLDLYFGYLNTPSVGISILGERNWKDLISKLSPNEHAIFVIANGTASFKGSGFVRGGIYDRIQVRQQDDTFTFRDTDYLNLYSIEAAGRPDYTESGIFIIRDPMFSAAYPFHFAFLGNKLDSASNEKTFANFDAEYWLPARYLEGGRPVVSEELPTWVKTWQSKQLEIIAFVLFLGTVMVFHLMRSRFERASRRKDMRRIEWFRWLVWLISIGFVGFWQLAQPSVTQLLTLIHTPFDGWQWSLFLSDPLIFIFWIFIAITLLLWGRGIFCGWLCPFGSLSEILYKIGGRIGLPRLDLPRVWHDRLKWVKYVVLAVLVAASFHSMILAEKLAEIEPFKTTFLVGIWSRSWPFVLFVAVLFGVSLFSERFYCKYICPLGAGLALPSKLRLLALRRKNECGPCKACANTCGSQAISADGRIDPMECMQCLECMVYYYDDAACPPLAKERKRREREGEPLTGIGKDGYFIPIRKVP